MIEGFKKGYWYRLKEDYVDSEIDQGETEIVDFKWRKCDKTVCVKNFDDETGYEWCTFHWTNSNGVKCKFDCLLQTMEECNPKEILKEIIRGMG